MKEKINIESPGCSGKLNGPVNRPNMCRGSQSPITITLFPNKPTINDNNYFDAQAQNGKALLGSRVSSKQCLGSWCEVRISTLWPRLLNAKAVSTINLSAPPEIETELQPSISQPKTFTDSQIKMQNRDIQSSTHVSRVKNTEYWSVRLCEIRKALTRVNVRIARRSSLNLRENHVDFVRDRRPDN